MTADEIGRILDELGERLGPTGSYVFELAVRQVYINAVVALIGLVVVIAIGAIVARPLYRWVQGAGTYDSRDIAALLIVLPWAGTLAFALIAVVISVPAMFNPEYAALRDLLGAIQ